MIHDCNTHPENNVKKQWKNNEKKRMKKKWKKQYIYMCVYDYVCIINVTKMVFVETVLTVSDCIMTVRFGIVWNGLDGFIL